MSLVIHTRHASMVCSRPPGVHAADVDGVVLTSEGEVVFGVVLISGASVCKVKR